MALDPRSKFMFTAANKSIKVWRLKDLLSSNDENTVKELFTFSNVHTDRIRSIQFDYGNKFLFSCSSDKSIKVFWMGP
jgi:WD40 repeat protein